MGAWFMIYSCATVAAIDVLTARMIVIENRVVSSE
jgi:hypothetical protein